MPSMPSTLRPLFWGDLVITFVPGQQLWRKWYSHKAYEFDHVDCKKLAFKVKEKYWYLAHLHCLGFEPLWLKFCSIDFDCWILYDKEYILIFFVLPLKLVLGIRKAIFLFLGTNWTKSDIPTKLMWFSMLRKKLKESR